MARLEFVVTVRTALALAMLAMAGGCASKGEMRDPRDPLEPYNRFMYQFNDTVDRAVLKPVATGYNKIMPAPADLAVSNFFGNLADVQTAINNLLQFKLQHAASDAGRVLSNTTIGLLGLIDVASSMGLEKHNEDFGQTLGAWGVKPGPYFVIPILGPSTIRDTAALYVDWKTDLVRYFEPKRVRYGLIGLRAVDLRADNLSTTKIIDEAALDAYEFTRDAWLQRRRYLVYDGNPPLQEELFDEEYLDERGQAEPPTDADGSSDPQAFEALPGPSPTNRLFKGLP